MVEEADDIVTGGTIEPERVVVDDEVVSGGAIHGGCCNRCGELDIDCECDEEISKASTGTKGLTTYKVRVYMDFNVKARSEEGAEDAALNEMEALIDGGELYYSDFDTDIVQ